MFKYIPSYNTFLYESSVSDRTEKIRKKRQQERKKRNKISGSAAKFEFSKERNIFKVEQQIEKLPATPTPKNIKQKIKLKRRLSKLRRAKYGRDKFSEIMSDE